MRKHKNTVHLSLEFPEDEHFHLKMICAQQKESIKNFVIASVRKSMQQYEEKILKGIDKGLKDIKEGRIVYREASDFAKYADD